MGNNITLIGMAGAGKSAAGKALAKKLDCRFIDIDEVIEEKFDLKLQEIIDKYGEEKFLEEEEKAVLALEDIEKCVISPGGSIVYSSKAMEFLQNISKIFFLDAPLQIIESRIKNQELRRIIGLDKKSIKEVFTERRPLYEKWADIKIEIKENSSVDDVVKIIISEFLPSGFPLFLLRPVERDF